MRALRGRIACFTRNVKRWQGGAMLLRWVGAAVLQAALGFRRLRGYWASPVLMDTREGARKRRG